MTKAEWNKIKDEVFWVDGVKIRLLKEFKKFSARQAFAIIEELSLYILQGNMESAKRFILTYRPYFIFEKEKK